MEAETHKLEPSPGRRRIRRELLLTFALSGVLPGLGSVLLWVFAGERKWQHAPLHSTMETAGALIALGMAALLMLRARQRERASHFGWVTVALVCMGLLDLTHACVRVSPAFFWSRGLPTLLGGLLFAMVWAPARWLDARRTRRLVAVAGALTLGVCAALLLFPEAWPRMFSAEGYTLAAKLLNVTGGLGFIAAAAHFARCYARAGERDNLVFANHCLLFGVAGVLFMLAHMWGVIWWLFHGVRLLAYVVVLRYVFDLYQAYEAEQRARAEEGERRARAEAEQAFALLDSFFSAAPVGFAVLDRGLRHVRVNRVLAEALRSSPEQLVGRPIREALTDRTAQALEPQLRRVMESGEPIVNAELEGAVALAGPDGPRWFLASHFPVRTGRGEVQGVSSVLVDITELKRAEQRAVEAVRIRDDFLSVASHELKTPLTSFKLQLELLKRLARRAPEELAREMGTRMAVLERQTARLGTLNDSLLDVTRISTARLGLELSEVELPRLLREVVKRFEPHCQHTGCELRVRCEGDLAGYWDKGKLDRILTHLVSNAVKYGPGKPIEILATSEGDGVAITVKDHGIGIPPDAMDRLFEKFERAVPVSHYGGLGLGLFICRELVQAMGGSISVASAAGEGATFTVRLPMRAPAEPDVEPLAGRLPV